MAHYAQSPRLATICETVFWNGGPVKLRLKPSSEEHDRWFEAQLHWE
jgi:hypothetical protein